MISFHMWLIAALCHQANKAYCESIGDFSQVPWEEAPENLQQSTLKGVQYRLENPTSTPEDQHNAWLKDKESQGWKFGEVKDADKKEHPCFIPYSELPQAQRSKDYIFQAIVDTVVAQFPEEFQVFTES